MANLYPAGKTINIPVSLDVVWDIITKALHQQTQANGGEVVSPPRRRPSKVMSQMLAFVKANPGLYCTREILQQHPGSNAGSVKWALYQSRKRGLMDRTEDGKWYAKNA
jgi:hypothetical protein